jgi:hypothetical protein
MRQTMITAWQACVGQKSWPRWSGTISLASRRRKTALNLVLVARPRHGHGADFQTITHHIRDLAPHVHPTVLSDRHYNRFRADRSFRPTLTVSPLEIRRLTPFRGPVLQNRFLRKSAEYEALERVGIPVPRWAVLSHEQTPDLSEFGDYVVTKPDCGGKGAEVKIKRRGRVRWKPPKNRRSRNLGETNLVVQEFIYTGRWPISYRVTTLFGRVLFAWKVEASRSRRPLSGPDKFGEGGAGGGGMSIVSSGSECRFVLTDDPEILNLAQRAHSALPNHPLLGIDIVREEPSGRLFVLELNSCGHLWHFSSQTGLEIQRSSGIDFAGQFNGLRRAAEVLIEQTERRAA